MTGPAADAPGTDPQIRKGSDATRRSRAWLRRPTRIRWWSRLGLRARVTVTFAVGAFVLSALLAGITYFSARQAFVNERQSASQHQAFVNASFVQNALKGPGADPVQTLESVDALSGSRSVLFNNGQWFNTSLSVGQSALPVSLRHLVISGTPATQVFNLGGTPELVVGVPLTTVHATYFEVFSLDELAGTLRVLALALAAAALVTTIAGAVIGRWISGRLLRPLAGISEAAVAIAGGELGTRVEAGDDADLKALAGSFNRMAGNLQGRIEREARFTSDVSHELRSPLTTLSASVGVLETHRGELSPQAQRALSLLEADLTRFRRMVDDLLEISRFDAGSAELSLDDVNPGELVRRAVASTMPIGEDGNRQPVGFSVEVSPEVDPLRLRVDKRRFERIMANLVDNARLYGDGVSRVVVEAGLGPNGTGAEPVTAVRVAVEDHGPGVPDLARPHLFERFYRGRASGRRGSGEGTGLGLSLVAEHVRLHGGSVWIEDAPGGGARFVVQLPLDPEAAPIGTDVTSLPEEGTLARDGAAPLPPSRTSLETGTGS
ncbi:MAG TPA: HAMP domain-containing sensor histidine kinase [Acidimicrobiales bacterium]|nr:HAMP domain-containing sensor histidine kinase [Acidimicrobiales bacterium]